MEEAVGEPAVDPDVAEFDDGAVAVGVVHGRGEDGEDVAVLPRRLGLKSSPACRTASRFTTISMCSIMAEGRLGRSSRT